MSGTGTRSALPLAMTALFLGLVACSSQPKPTEAQTSAQTPQTQLQRYDLKGKVVSVDKSAKKLMVDHEAIEATRISARASYAGVGCCRAWTSKWKFRVN